MNIPLKSLIEAVEKAKIYVPSVHLIEDYGTYTPKIIDADILLSELRKMEE